MKIKYFLIRNEDCEIWKMFQLGRRALGLVLFVYGKLIKFVLFRILQCLITQGNIFDKMHLMIHVHARVVPRLHVKYDVNKT